MKTRLIQIGNSLGVCIPKRLLKQLGLKGEVEICAENGALMIRPPKMKSKKARAGWAAAFQKKAQRGDDRLIDDAPPSLSTWDEGEWEW